ncbi:SDR family oxidoreductase [Bordetella tumulicola]|uniref:SDR family oxidoreductase n=1 Tax=Bordetella tumulicola TaxID=1649133 RepID=UPI0039EF35BD
MNSLKAHRVALITGASRGIGAATAVALARQGFQMVLGMRDTRHALEVLGQIEAVGVAAWAVEMDVSNSDSVQAAVDFCLKQAGQLDALVNNAGRIDPISLLADTDVQAWVESHNVNLGGPYRAIRYALPALLRSPAPTIVNLSSGAAHATREGWSAYCSAKAGLAMLTRCVAHEYPQVACYGFQPGFVDTAMQASIRASGINDISRLARSALAPAEHPAACIAWLCATRPSDIAGRELSINDTALQASMKGSAK